MYVCQEAKEEKKRLMLKVSPAHLVVNHTRGDKTYLAPM
jgi:hypothetical protein